jgi:hypothetical protein|eukprot:SAG25_NODE_1106_length_3951_cov_2.250260_4_plen_118_part_00
MQGRCRTTLNVVGDSVVAAIVDTKLFGLDPALTASNWGTGTEVSLDFAPGPLRTTVDLQNFSTHTQAAAALEASDGESATAFEPSAAGELAAGDDPASARSTSINTPGGKGIVKARP